MTVAAAAAAVVSVSVALHEATRLLATLAVGGEPTLLLSTGLQGDWSGLSDAGYVALGVSGSVASGILALVGWRLAQRGVGSPTMVAVTGWLLFAVNAWLPTVHLVLSPLLEFGDWMAIIDRFPNRNPLRASLIVTGLFISGLVWKETVPSLARVIGNGNAMDRRARALRLVRAAWLATGVVAGVAALLGPDPRAALLAVALAGTWGSMWPILVAGRRVGGHPVPGDPLRLRRSLPVIAGGIVVAVAFVVLLGSGIPLSH
ncbi:MAG: hypothetical protein OSA81_01745 [Longimicrobiales bacterium]|nr:hypothetical protein [Longimicrobiales bacterium]